ncbi:hypothetical protein NL676_010846 [Syzygium grande]|nr:hypothetical protein NL676_010846 [Syzygium grande]
MASANAIARSAAKAIISVAMDSQPQPWNGHSAIPPLELEFVDYNGLAEGCTLKYIGHNKIDDIQRLQNSVFTAPLSPVIPPRIPASPP